MPPKVSTPAKPPPGWQSNPNRSSRQPELTQQGVASNPTYFQCSDCSQITTVLGDLGRHWGQDDRKPHNGAWFTEKAHMFKRETEGNAHVEYHCVGKHGNTLIWKRCHGQPLVDGENDSMIDKAGNEYVKQNGVFMKTQAASRTQRPTPGDEEDEGYEEGDLTNSVGGRRGTRRQQLTHQTGTGGSLQDEPSSGNDEDGARTNPNISIDSLETHKHMGSFDGENQSLSPAVTNNEPMAKSNLLASIPPNANVLDDVIAAVEIQRDLDDREHPGSLNDKEQALRESRKTAAAEKIKQEKQARQFTGTRSCGFDQLPSMPALGYVESMSPSSGSTLQLNRHSVSEGPARGQGCFSSPANAGSKKQHDVRRPSSSISPGLLSSRRRSSATRDTFGSATFHPPGHRAAILPEERWSQRDKVIFQRGFEKGRRYGRTEQRNAAKVLIQAQAQGGGMDDDEMDEEDG